MRLLAVLFLLPLLWLNTARADGGQPLALPSLTSPVMDEAGLLAPPDAERLRQKLLALSREKGSQIVVFIVPTTAPEDIFTFSMRAAETWKPGRKGVDDGVLIVIAVQDRRSRIEVGYGLEGAIPDARAKQVLDDIMAPHFRQGDFAGGLDAGTDALISLIKGENLPAPAAQTGRVGMNENTIVMALACGIIAGFFGRLIFGRGGGAVAGFGTALTVALLLGAALLVAIFIAVFAAAFASGNGRGGFGGGSFGGGSFGGGGGFSGGGGSFGGGGASGSW